MVGSIHDSLKGGRMLVEVISGADGATAHSGLKLLNRRPAEVPHIMASVQKLERRPSEGGGDIPRRGAAPGLDSASIGQHRSQAAKGMPQATPGRAPMTSNHRPGKQGYVQQDMGR